MIYFDHASTAGVRPASVTEAMIHVLQEISANPGRSGHRRSIEAARIIEDARSELASLIGAKPSSHVILTKNATEAINLFLFGFLQPGDAVLASRFEHNSVMRPLRALEHSHRIRVEDLPGTTDRPVDLEATEEILASAKGGIRLVAVNLASNVTGRIFPIREIGSLCARHNARLLVDAAQGAGLLDIDVDRDRIDALALTGHKSLLGPQGTGALYLRDPMAVQPLLHGGTGSRSEEERQPEFPPDRFEAGTLNLPGFAGLAAALRDLRAFGMESRRRRESQLLRHLWEALSDLPGLTPYGAGALDEQLALVSFAVDGWDLGKLARELDRAGICCRPGLHCAPRAHRTLGTDRMGGTIRFSLSYTNSEEEIDQAVMRLREIITR